MFIICFQIPPIFLIFLGIGIALTLLGVIMYTTFFGKKFHCLFFFRPRYWASSDTLSGVCRLCLSQAQWNCDGYNNCWGGDGDVSEWTNNAVSPRYLWFARDISPLCSHCISYHTLCNVAENSSFENSETRENGGTVCIF